MKKSDLKIPMAISIKWKFVGFWTVYLLLATFCALRYPSPTYPVIDALTGHAQHADVVVDMYGFRALVLDLDPYASTDAASEVMQTSWRFDPPLVSPHPPTALLLAAPVAFFSWPLASALWAWLMVASLGATLKLLRLPLLLLVPVLLWPPAALSFGQLTWIWLIAAVMAWRNQDRPFTAGIWIGLAAFTKYLPAVLLIPFMLRRKWSAAAGFALVWLIALLLITALQPTAIQRYVEVNLSVSPETVARPDNGSLLVVLRSWFGWLGFAVGLAFLLAVGIIGRRDWHTFEFLAVAFLPIMWIYSLLPLLPGIAANRRSGLTVAAVALTFITPPFSKIFPYFSVSFIVLYGVALMLRSSARLAKT